MPFIHNIDPVIFSIGPLSIRYYGLPYIIGFAYLYYLLMRAAEKSEISGLDKSLAEEFLIYFILGVIVGARLGFFLFNMPFELISDPLEIFRLWHGGMSFHGGFIGTAIAGYIFCRKHRMSSASFFGLADLSAVAAALGLALGRIANFINAELVGKVTSVQWCVYFPGFEGCRHPYQLYESAALFIVFGTLLFSHKRFRLQPGAIFWLFTLLYGLQRLITNFWRDDPMLAFGLSGGQLLSIAMILLGLGMLIKTAKSHSKT